MKTLERLIVGLLTTFVLLVTAVAVGGTAGAWAIHDRVPRSAQADVATSQSAGDTALATVLIVAIWLAWCLVLLMSVKGGRFLIKRLAH